MSNHQMVKTASGIDIIETKTNQVIRSCTSTKEAADFVRHLEKGGGFNGHTPPFFVANTSPEAAQELRNLQLAVDF